MIGHDVENGELPCDMDPLGDMVRNISYGNVARLHGTATVKAIAYHRKRIKVILLEGFCGMLGLFPI